MTKRIPVGESYALVDDEDYEWLSQYKWFLRKSSHTDIIYARLSNGGKYMHQLITGFEQTDHLNRIGLDNRRSNLRSCSGTQNQANRPKQKGNYISAYKGVTWNKRANKWEAQITRNRKKHYLGVFSNEEDAARAYDVKALELFGEFSVLNFPEIK